MSEKRGFGSKLSSIFNQGPGSPNDKKSHAHTTRGISSSPSPKPKPLSKPHLNNNRSISATLNLSLHPTNHGAHSLHSKSSSSTLRGNAPVSAQYSTFTGHQTHNHPEINTTQPTHELYTETNNHVAKDHHNREKLLDNRQNLPLIHREEELKPSLLPLHSLHPSTSANSSSPKLLPLRRKPPSDLDSFDFAVHDQRSERTSGSTRSLSQTPKLDDKMGTGITADIIGDLESEIDHFLQLDKSDSSSIRYTPSDSRSIGDSVYFDREYDESHPDFVQQLNLNRSKAYGQLGEAVEGSGIHTQQTPYPVDSFLGSPSDSPPRTPAESLENSPQIIQNYMMDTRGLEKVNPFEITLNQQIPEQHGVFDAPASSKSSVYTSASPTRQRTDYEASTNPSSSNTMAASTAPQSVRSLISRSSTNTSRIPSSSLPFQSPTHSIHQQPQALNRVQGMQPAHPSQPRQPPQPPLQHTLTENSGFSFSHANSMKSYNTLNTHRNFHRNSSSVGSIKSSNSYKNVNLASLKRSLSLKPGEGERSNYVLAIRRSAGTAFNELGPSRWKLPVGILPIDKLATKENSNGKYKRLAGGLSGNNSRKKTSGVDLKHGHLKPRLLAAEIDEGDDGFAGIGLARTTTTNPSVANTFSSRNQSVSTKASRENSLKRTTTDGSVLTGDTQSIVSSATGSTKGINDASLNRTNSIVSSESSGSLSDKITGYYQHRGYKYGDIDEESEDKSGVESPGTQNNGSSLHGFNINDSYEKQEKYDDYEEQDHPRLVLANPDNDSDTE